MPYIVLKSRQNKTFCLCVRDIFVYDSLRIKHISRHSIALKRLETLRIHFVSHFVAHFVEPSSLCMPSNSNGSKMFYLKVLRPFESSWIVANVFKLYVSFDA